MNTDTEVMRTLATVMDPEIHINIVDLEMVRSVDIKNGNASVLIALTVPDCPMANTIKSDVQKVLLGIDGIDTVSVETTSMTPSELAAVRSKIQGKAVSPSGTSDQPASSTSPIDRLDKKGIENLVAIISGKGGVGKSFITSLLATGLRRSGYEVGVLDADITGPSIAKVFGLTSRPMGGPNGILPVSTKTGIKVMSLNLLLDDPEKPAIWRGPIVNNLIRQLYRDVDWGDLHYLLVDLPPGTSDAPLTVFQSIPLSGVIVVSTPQELSRMIVTKSANMAKSLNIPLLGLVENMAFLVCRECNHKEFVFGEPQGQMISEKLDVPFLGSFPIDPNIAELSDKGAIEDYSNQEFYELVSKLRLQIAKFGPQTQMMPIAWKMSKGEAKTRKFELKPM